MQTIAFMEFKKSLHEGIKPAGLTKQAEALWLSGHSDWEDAHDIVQDLKDAFSFQIHAFLHRKEGDFSNAAYWYAKAGVPFPSVTLEKEWEGLVRTVPDT